MADDQHNFAHPRNSGISKIEIPSYLQPNPFYNGGSTA